MASASGKRGLKLHSIIEKLSEQCERKSPLHDEEGEDIHLNSEVFNIKRKQRKGNGVKRVCKETLSRSSSEEGWSDEEIDVTGEESQNDKDYVNKLEQRASASYKSRRAAASPRAAKTNTRRKQIIKQQQISETRTLKKKNKKQSKGKNVKSRVNISKAIIKETGNIGEDKDLAIDVEAFVNHSPVVEDIDQAVAALFPCPFCSVLCRSKQDVIQHIKDSHNSECAVVDDSEHDDEELSSDSELPATDSDEDFTPDKETTPKRRSKCVSKLQKYKYSKTSDEESESELRIDVENVMNTDSGVNDIDGPCIQTTAAAFSCLKCSVDFKTQDELTTHTADCNKQDSSKDSPKFRCGCQACGMRFYQWAELRQHFDNNPDCKKLYQCDECDQVCLTTSFLKKHKKLHSDDRPHKCSVCDAAFKDKAYLKRHGVKHTGVKEFKCDVCDKLFSHQRTLKEHRRRHTGEKPYKCKYCEARFTNSSSLKTHTTKHTGILPYKCQACGKLFAKSYGLKMHSLSHSTDKPFVCEVCGKGFKRPDHFKQHKIIHSDNKPFKCDTCQRTFNQKVCLRKHLPCKEHEKQQKKLQNSVAKENQTRNKPKRSRNTSAKAQKSVDSEVVSQEGTSNMADNTATDSCEVSNDFGLSSSIDTSGSSFLAGCYSTPKRSRKTSAKAQQSLDSEVVSQEGTSNMADNTATDSCEVSNDFGLSSSIDTSESSFLAGCYTPSTFVRPISKLIDNEYYSDQEQNHQEYHQHDRDFSSQHLTDRAETNLLPASFVPAMFSVEEPLSLDTLPPLPSHHTHALSGRPLSHDNASDLGSVLLSSAMDPENLRSIVEETNSLFDHD